MGHPKFARRKFDSPKHPWKKARIDEEHDLQSNYGLKNMKEIWKAKTQLRRYRQQAMKLIGRVDTTEDHWGREKQDLLTSLQRKGMLGDESSIDDVLVLTVENVLDRRLQSQVYYKGKASSMKQARQMVTHGHISVGNQKITIPSYPVSREEEDLIVYQASSPLTNEEHRIRMAIAGIEVEEPEVLEEEPAAEEPAAEEPAAEEPAAEEPAAEEPAAEK